MALWIARQIFSLVAGMSSARTPRGASAFITAFNTAGSVPTKLNPMGAKGAGEAGTVGALPAVMNAVMNALAPRGVRALDVPATSEKIWRAIHGAAV